MTRKIIISTKTTGFIQTGETPSRVLAINAIEVMDDAPTGKVFNHIFNPECVVPAWATKLHGIDNATVAEKPTFKEVAQEFLDFVGNHAPVLVYDANVDIAFVNAELKRAELPIIDTKRVHCVLTLALQKFPYQDNSLKQLCDNLNIPNNEWEISVLSAYTALTNNTMDYTDVIGVMGDNHDSQSEFWENSTTESIKTLLEAGFNPNAHIDNQGDTIFRLALLHDASVDVINTVLEYGINFTNNKGTLLLEQACLHKDPLPVIQALIAHGVDINKRDAHGNTAFAEVAGLLKNTDVIQFLLDIGADIHTPNNDGETILMEASDRTNKPLMEALIQNGADVNAKDADGITPLMCAARNNESNACIRLLLANGADIHAKDKEDETILFAASDRGYPSVLETLIKNGADVNVRNNDGKTPLIEASYSWNRNNDSIRILIQYGANVNARDNGGNTPLTGAIGHENLARIEILTDNGADVNTRDGDGETLLMQTITRGNPKVSTVQALIEHGADVNARDNNRKTVLIHAAQYCENLDIIKLLIANNADVNAWDEDGKTALDYAKENDYLKSAEIYALLQLNQASHA